MRCNQSIGAVHNSFTEKPKAPREEIVSEIVVDPRWQEALDGIDEFSYIIALFWLHQVEGER